MKKKIVLMISSIFAAILLVVSIVLVIILRSTTDTPINNDVPKVNVGESIVLVNLKKNIKTRFFVGDNMPDLTTYFDIYEDFNPVEVKHEYITTELNMSQAGAYDVVCSYNYYKESVMIYVEDVYKLTTTEESIEVTVEQKNIDYKQYFHLTKNGNNMDITDEMLSIHVDTSQEGRGTVNCAYMNQSKSIIVFVKPKEEIPDITTPGPDVSVDGVKLVVSKN